MESVFGEAAAFHSTDGIHRQISDHSLFLNHQQLWLSLWALREREHLESDVCEDHSLLICQLVVEFLDSQYRSPGTM